MPVPYSLSGLLARDSRRMIASRWLIREHVAQCAGLAAVADP
jgi:hypothetical protein